MDTNVLLRRPKDMLLRCVPCTGLAPRVGVVRAQAPKPKPKPKPGHQPHPSPPAQPVQQTATATARARKAVANPRPPSAGRSAQYVVSLRSHNSAEPDQLSMSAGEQFQVLVGTGANTVTLDRSGGQSIGIKVKKATADGTGIAVKSVEEGGQAEATGKLQAGTVFSHVNGTDVTGMKLKDIGALIKEKDQVVFTIAGWHVVRNSAGAVGRVPSNFLKRIAPRPANPGASGAEALALPSRITPADFAPGATEVPADMFKGRGEIVSVELPATITAIGDYAFADCAGLVGPLVLPHGIVTIGEGAPSRRACRPG